MSVEPRETEDRILLTACKLFAQLGFEGVKHRHLAREAGVNSALINYYFRSKRGLFEKVLDHCFNLTNEKYEVSGQELPGGLAEVKLIARSRLLPVFDEGPAGWFPRLIYHEMNSSNSDKERIMKRYLLPKRQRLTKVLADYLEAEEDDLLVRTTVFNIASQWIMMNIARSRNKGIFADGGIAPEEVEIVIENVLEFITGGLRHARSLRSKKK